MVAPIRRGQLDMQELHAMFDDCFPLFLQAVWMDRRLDRYHPFGYIEEDLCGLLGNDDYNKLVILACRGFGKTHILQAWVLWRLFVDPHRRILVASRSEKHAMRFIHAVRNWINQIWFLRHLTPRKAKAWVDKEDRFFVGPTTPAGVPSVLAMGFDSQLEGSRAHDVVIDDGETKSNCETVQAREKRNARAGEFVNIASYDYPRIIYLGTYHHEDSLYLSRQRAGYTLRSYPLLIPEPEDKVIGLAPCIQQKIDAGEMKPGDIVQPNRRDRQYVEDRRAEGDFDRQQMLIAEPKAGDQYPVQLANFIVFAAPHSEAPTRIAWGTNKGPGTSTALEDIPSPGFGTDRFFAPIMVSEDPAEWSKYTRTVMVVDPNVTGSGDRTGVSIGSEVGGLIYVHHVYGFEDAFGLELIWKLLRLAEQYMVHEIHLETNRHGTAGLQLFEGQLRDYTEQRREENRPEKQDNDGIYTLSDPKEPPVRTWGCTIIPYTVTGQKEQRIINCIVPPINSHRVIINPTVARNLRFTHQLVRLTGQRGSLKQYGDDEIDAFARMVELLSENIADNPDKVSERARQRQIDEYLAQVRKDTGRSDPTPRYWQLAS